MTNPYPFYAAGGGFQGVTNQFRVEQTAADEYGRARFNAGRALASDDMQYARMADDVARAEYSAASSLGRDALQQRRQDRAYDDQRGDIRFSQGLMLSQEARAKDQAKLRREQYEAELKLERDALNLDQRVAGEEGRLLMQQFDAAQRREKELAESLKQLDRQIQFQTDVAAKRGLVADRDGFFKPSGLQAMDPEAAKTAALVNRNLRELVGAVTPLSDEITRARELQDQTRAKAARARAYFTSNGLATATGSFYPFPASAGPVAPAPAPAAPMTAAPPAPTTNWIDAVSPFGRPYRVQR